MKITKDNKDLIIRVSLTAERFNPYMEQSTSEMDNIVALITNDKFGNDEIGFCYYIDMDYKGKDDQFTDFWLKWWEGKEDFIKICKELKIDIVYLPQKVED